MVSSLTKNTANILNVLLQIIILVTLRVLGSNRVTIKIKISKSDWYRIKALKIYENRMQNMFNSIY